MVAERVQRTRLLRQGGEIRDFGDGQFVHRLVEIVQRCGSDAVVGKAEINFIEVELENLLLRIGRLNSHAQQDLADLAVESPVGVQEEVLRHLLGDGRGALDVMRTLEVNETRAHDSLGIDAVVGVEVLVLGRYEGFLDQGGNFVRRKIEPPLARIFREEAAVSGVHARHHRRLIVLELRIVRQVLLIFPDDDGEEARRHDEHQRAGSKYEADNASDTAHLSIEAFHCARRRALEASRRTLISALRRAAYEADPQPFPWPLRSGSKIEPGGPARFRSRLGRMYDQRAWRQATRPNTPARPPRASVNGQAARRFVGQTRLCLDRPAGRLTASRLRKRRRQWR